MTKYGFRIRTRGGMMVESLQVHARDREEAERKINQIYQQCEIVECQELTPAGKPGGVDFEDVIALINREPDVESSDRAAIANDRRPGANPSGSA